MKRLATDWLLEWLRLAGVCRIDPDTLTLDQFVGLIDRVDLLRLSQSDREQDRNVLGLAEMERQVAVAKAAGVRGGIL